MINKLKAINLLIDLNDLEIKKMKKILGRHEEVINTISNDEPFFITENNTIIAGFVKDNILYVETFQQNIKIL